MNLLVKLVALIGGLGVSRNQMVALDVHGRQQEWRDRRGWCLHDPGKEKPVGPSWIHLCLSKGAGKIHGTGEGDSQWGPEHGMSPVPPRAIPALHPWMWLQQEELLGSFGLQSPHSSSKDTPRSSWVTSPIVPWPRGWGRGCCGRGARGALPLPELWRGSGAGTPPLQLQLCQ